MNAFWFHFNKPLSQSKGHPVMTVHYRNACIPVRHIICKVPVSTRERRQQPRMVIAGRGVVRVKHDTATITEI